jgi:hypothetical protein
MVAVSALRACEGSGGRVTLGESCVQDISSNISTHCRSSAEHYE